MLQFEGIIEFLEIALTHPDRVVTDLNIEAALKEIRRIKENTNDTTN